MGKIGGAMPRQPWFDPESNRILFNQYIDRLESWMQAMADGVITPDEVDRQAERVAGLLRDLEPKLSDELHAEVTNLLYELAVFNEMIRVEENTRAAGKGSHPAA
jgi:hypothetical protein